MLEQIHDNFNQVNNSNQFETAACRKEAIQISLSNDQHFQFVRQLHWFLDDDVPYFVECMANLELGFLKTEGDIGLDDVYLRKVLLMNLGLRKFISELATIWNKISKESIVFSSDEAHWKIDFRSDETFKFFRIIDKYIYTGISIDLIENSKYFIVNNNADQNDVEFKRLLDNFFYVYENIARLELNWPHIKTSIYEKWKDESNGCSNR